MDLVGYKFQRKKWKLHGEVTSMRISVVPSVSLPVHVWCYCYCRPFHCLLFVLYSQLYTDNQPAVESMQGFTTSKAQLNSHHALYIQLYCILRGQIKGFNSSITTMLFEVGSYRNVVGKLQNARVQLQNSSKIDTFLSKKSICLFNKCVKFQRSVFC